MNQAQPPLVRVIKTRYYTGPKKGDVGTLVEMKGVGTLMPVVKVDFGKKGIWHMRPWELRLVTE